MLGGGIWGSQTKKMPGAYINFVSAANSVSDVSERGVVALPMVLGWGPEKKVFELTAEEFARDTRPLLGYTRDTEALKVLREVFCHATKVVLYRMNSGVKAQNSLATARYSGVCGNGLKIVVAANVDSEDKLDVVTLLEGREVDRQSVAGMGALVDNDYVVWKKEGTLEATAGMPLSGGSDGEAVTGEEHAAFLDAMEACSFHILCCPAVDETTKALYVEFTRRMREDAGVKFQTVLYKKSDADYEGVISVDNAVEGTSPQALVYWVAGAEAACEINRTNDNLAYDGEYTVDTAYTQQQLADAIDAGKYVLHRVNDQVRVLTDINTFTGYTQEKGADFSNNQTVRVLDQIGNDIAVIFNTQFFGKMPNDASGRISLWNEVVSYAKQLATLRAIEPVAAEDIEVMPGENRKAVVVMLPVTPINCMAQLYMTVVVA